MSVFTKLLLVLGFISILFLVTLGAITFSNTVRTHTSLLYLNLKGYKGGYAQIVEKELPNIAPSGQKYSHNGISFITKGKIVSDNTLEEHKSFTFDNDRVLQTPSFLFQIYYDNILDPFNNTEAKNKISPKAIEQYKYQVNTQDLTDHVNFYRKFIEITPSNITFDKNDGETLLNFLLLTYKSLSDHDGVITKYKGEKYTFFEFTPLKSADTDVNAEYIVFGNEMNGVRTFRLYMKDADKDERYGFLNSIEIIPTE